MKHSIYIYKFSQIASKLACSHEAQRNGGQAERLVRRSKTSYFKFTPGQPGLTEDGLTRSKIYDLRFEI